MQMQENPLHTATVSHPLLLGSTGECMMQCRDSEDDRCESGYHWACESVHWSVDVRRDGKGFFSKLDLLLL